MLSRSSVHPDTVQAYLETEYHVFWEPAFCLQVGQPSAELRRAHHQKQANCSAFLTACNPYSQAFDAASNRSRQEKLAKQLAMMQLEFVAGMGQHPSNTWPGEESFLVFGISLDIAKVLGTDLQQNGFIWSDSDATPQLILLR